MNPLSVPAHPLASQSTEANLYGVASVLSFLASQDRNDTSEGDVGYGRSTILRLCASALLHESDKAGRTGAEVGTGK